MICTTIVGTDRAVTVARPAPLFDVDFDDVASGFDVAQDGKSIFMRRRTEATPRTAGSRLVLVQNWLAEFAK